MNKTATAFALCALSLLFGNSNVKAQQKPAAEYTAVWDAALNRWKDTVQTFTMVYSPEYKLSSRTGNYQTTYSGFIPATGEVYQNRYFWEPRMTASQIQVDSVHENGLLTPVRLDQYDRTVPRKTSFTRSMWDGTDWKIAVRSVSTVDSLGILSSSVNHAIVNGKLVLTDSTHVYVTQDMKGNVLNVRVSDWSMQDPVLRVVAEQRYTLAGDGSIAVAELWNTATGELAPALRMHSFDWVVRSKSFPYVQREQGAELFYGGDAYRSAIFDIHNGTDWMEYYQVQQTFDAENRLTSYTFNGTTRDTFTFDQGLITLNQHDEIFGNQWMTGRGTRTIYDRDANGTLRSVTIQRYDATTSKYVNERQYIYTFGSADVEPVGKLTTLSIYPNPVTEIVTIESEEPVISASVVSTTGAVVLQTDSDKIDVRNLAPGAYGLKVATSSKVETLKFIKVH